MTAEYSAIATFEPAAPERQVAASASVGWPAIREILDRSERDAQVWARAAATRATALDAWADALEARAAEAAQLVAREVGKPITEAAAEVVRSVAIIRYYAQAAYEPIGEELPPVMPGILRLIARREPIGTLLAVTPWNFPLAIPTWKIAPALAFGNRVVIRGSSRSVGVAAFLAETADGVLPPGLLVSWTGPSWAIHDAIRDPRVAAVSFTGSEVNGRHAIQAAGESGKPAQAEMGGQNAAIVLADADIDGAAAAIVSAGMTFAGQKCTATRRVIVAESRVASLVEALRAATEAVVVGDPLDPRTTAGPLISSAAREHAAQRLTMVPRRQVVTGGRRSGPGWFLSPALVRLPDPGHLLAREELFAPVITILTARTDDEAVRIANGTRHGLVAGIYGDEGHAMRVAEALNVGVVRINAPTTGVDFHAPFAGRGASGFGPPEQGRAIREFVTRTITISVGSAGSPRSVARGEAT